VRTLLTHQQPPPTFLEVRDALTLEELTRGLRTPTSTTPSSSTSRALVAAPPPSSASPPASLLGVPPPGPSGGGGAMGGAEAAEDAVVGVEGRPPRLRPPLSLLFPEVRPGQPSPTRGQGVSPCGPTRVREGGLVPRTSQRPWSRVLPPTRRHGLHLHHPARRGRGVGSDCTGAVLQHCGADAARRHRVDRRLGCFLPHYS
jgi:hypothetical protein